MNCPMTPRLILRASEQASLLHAQRMHAQTIEEWRRIRQELPDAPSQALQTAQKLSRQLCTELATDANTALCLLPESALPVDADSAHDLHVVNVTLLALLMAHQLGLPGDELEAIALGALLHDIGELALPEPLRQAGPDQPRLRLRARHEHVVLGVRMGIELGLDTLALRVIAEHHERADGSGVPQGLHREEIAPATRIVALAELFHDLCHPRHPMQLPCTPHEALVRLFGPYRSQLDAVLLARFIRLLGIHPPGSVVELSDRRHALVVATDPCHPLRPLLLVHDPDVPREAALLLPLGRHLDLDIRRSLLPQQLSPDTFDYLAPPSRISYGYAHGLDSLTLTESHDTLAA